MGSGELNRMPRILIVDDNAGFLEILSEFLAEFDDMDVVGTAPSAEEALRLFSERGPDTLITDLSMPGMTGIELIRAVKSLKPTTRTVILTLFDSPQHRRAAQDAGADAFVPKASMDTDLPTVLELPIKPAA